MIHRLDGSLSALSSTFARNPDECLEIIKTEEELDEGEKVRLWNSTSRKRLQMRELPDGALIDVESSVCPAILQLGHAFCS